MKYFKKQVELLLFHPFLSTAHDKMAAHHLENDLFYINVRT